MIAQHSSRYNVLASLRDENRPHSGNRTERKEAGLLGPSQAQADWGQTLPSLALLGRTGADLRPTLANLRRARASWLQLGSSLGPTWAQLGSNIAQLVHIWTQVGPSMVLCGGIWRRSWAQDRPDLATRSRTNPHQIEAMWRTWKSKSRPKWRSLGPLGGSFAPSQAQRRHNMGNIASEKNGKLKNGIWEDFGLGRHMSPIWSDIMSWTSTWAEVAPKRVQFGAKLAKWVRWAQVGALLPKVTPNGADAAAMSDRNGPSGRWPICKLRKLPHSCALLAAAPAPQLKLHQSDRSVRSYPLLLNYHASGPKYVPFESDVVTGVFGAQVVFLLIWFPVIMAICALALLMLGQNLWLSWNFRGATMEKVSSSSDSDSNESSTSWKFFGASCRGFGKPAFQKQNCTSLHEWHVVHIMHKVGWTSFFPIAYA